VKVCREEREEVRRVRWGRESPSPTVPLNSSPSTVPAMSGSHGNKVSYTNLPVSDWPPCQRSGDRMEPERNVERKELSVRSERVRVWEER
jgi:hypothetical protein